MGTFDVCEVGVIPNSSGVEKPIQLSLFVTAHSGASAIFDTWQIKGESSTAVIFIKKLLIPEYKRGEDFASENTL